MFLWAPKQWGQHPRHCASQKQTLLPEISFRHHQRPLKSAQTARVLPQNSSSGLCSLQLITQRCFFPATHTLATSSVTFFDSVKLDSCMNQLHVIPSDPVIVTESRDQRSPSTSCKELQAMRSSRPPWRAPGCHEEAAGCHESSPQPPFLWVKQPKGLQLLLTHLFPSRLFSISIGLLWTLPNSFMTSLVRRRWIRTRHSEIIFRDFSKIDSLWESR